MQIAGRLRTPLLSLTITAALAFGAVEALRAQGAAGNGVPVTVTVTATSHDKAATASVPQSEVVVRQDGDVRRVISWKPATQNSQGLDLAIMIDNQLTHRISSNLDELRQFVRGQNDKTNVAVVYADYGSAKIEQGFTPDHEKAAKSFHIPSAIRGTSNGTFDAVRDMMKKWPDDGNRRVLVLISSGIDLSEGVSDTNPYRNVPLDNAIQAAQRANSVVFAIYASGDTRALRGDYLSINGQGSLDRLANETGGKAFFQGLSTPVSLEPFLQQMSGLLGQQYLLTFMAQANAKGDYSRLKVTSEQNGIELRAPEHVRVPRAQ
jgi:VWFA-related protein